MERGHYTAVRLFQQRERDACLITQEAEGVENPVCPFDRGWDRARTQEPPGKAAFWRYQMLGRDGNLASVGGVVGSKA